MGFLSWFEQNKDQAALQQSLDLGIDGELTQAQHDQQVLAERKQVTRQYTGRIKKVVEDKGEKSKEPAYRMAHAALTEGLFDCTVDDLYNAVGGKRGNRDTLPPIAQNAYLMAETLACEDLDNLSEAELKASKAQRRHRVVRGAAQSGRKAKDLSSWRDG
ncbi:hypothetical protein [Leptolyngbya sp. PCC 6406]|uniref:hypothetical protein n=1 Tax=Leptolyngbya sp. PCC 6406 TaxID=1173264 RepID=UPI0002AC31B5|nr:hypothetical protein [Leptolyngbya sp. PCC 6406]